MRTIALLIIFSISVCCTHAALTFKGSPEKVISIKADASSGIDELYVLADAEGVTALYTAQSASNTVNWYRFSRLGGAYAEQIPTQRDGSTYYIGLGADDMGYIIEDGTRRYYYWIVNYANHLMSIDDIAVSPECDCDMTALSVTGSGERINYYTINGAPKELSREIRITYSSLEYDETAKQYTTTERSEILSYLQQSIHVPAPLCDTEFTISGDRFLDEWGRNITQSTEIYNTVAIDIETEAVQTERDSENEMKEDATLGGSAPAEITFSAVTTDAVVFREWQIARDANFDIIDIRVNNDEMVYTFRDYGTTYVRFMASNAEGTCDRFSETYEVQVGESKIECPNAFSPGASEGVNDEWRVSYKSIVEFECHIFNSWGVKMAGFTDPSQGWDGKYRGKLVPSGVYYYVIRATGADGKQYKLSGDINIINYKGNNSNSTSPEY